MRTWVLAVGAATATILFIGLLQFSALGELTTWFSNGAQFLAAALAAVGCAVAARRSDGRRSRAWRWMSAGTGSWAAGQAVWSYYEGVLDREVPFPSLADVGFLAFPLVAGAGLVIWAGTQRHQAAARGRDLLDGAIIAISLLVLSWVVVMAPLVHGSEGSRFSLALSLAYPVGDLVLASLVLIALVRSESERMTLALLALGLGGFAVADSLFSYLTSTGNYSSTDLVSSGGWVFGFLFVAAAGLSVKSSSTGSQADAELQSGQSSWAWLLLPYLPLAAAGVALFVDLLQSDTSVLVDLLLGVTLVFMMLARQFLAMLDNQRLLRALAEAGGQLEHQATHDPLTGLPNRMLFAQRLDRALLSSSSDVSVLFCDLDNFKPVNDELGHAAGDLLLKVVAERLLSCVRSADTVARLGGDEFAILLENCPGAPEVADRVVAAMQEETLILGKSVPTSISVGVAHHHGIPRPGPVRAAPRASTSALAERRTRATDPVDEDGVVDAVDRAAAATRLLRLADTAMYAAKSAGKGRAAMLEVDPVLAPRLSPVSG